MTASVIVFVLAIVSPLVLASLTKGGRRPVRWGLAAWFGPLWRLLRRVYWEVPLRVATGRYRQEPPVDAQVSAWRCRLCGGPAHPGMPDGRCTACAAGPACVRCGKDPQLCDCPVPWRGKAGARGESPLPAPAPVEIILSHRRQSCAAGETIIRRSTMGGQSATPVNYLNQHRHMYRCGTCGGTHLGESADQIRATGYQPEEVTALGDRCPSWVRGRPLAESDTGRVAWFARPGGERVPFVIPGAVAMELANALVAFQAEPPLLRTAAATARLDVAMASAFAYAEDFGEAEFALWDAVSRTWAAAFPNDPGPIETGKVWCECEGECGRGTHLGRCPNVHGQPAYGTGSTVILTTAHLDHTPENCDPANLRAMCQGCHLHYDKDHHRETRARNRAEAVAASGQESL